MPEDMFADTDPVKGLLPAIEERIRIVLDYINSDRAHELSAMTAQWPAGETAALLEALPQQARQGVWELVPEELRGEVLAWLGDQVRASLLKKLDIGEAAAAASTMETPCLVEVVDDASKELREAILESLGTDERASIEDALSYPEGSAWRLMEREWVEVRADVPPRSSETLHIPTWQLTPPHHSAYGR
jgi:magnesium transporter